MSQINNQEKSKLRFNDMKMNTGKYRKIKSKDNKI